MSIAKGTIRQTISVLSEAVKYDTTDRKKKEEMREFLEKIIRHSLFLSESKKELYVKPLPILGYDILLDLKDTLIRENLRTLGELIRQKVVEQEMMEKFKQVAGGR